jgi:hypothetical protein
MSTAAFNRILVKLSGEALMGGGDYGIEPAMLKRVAAELVEVSWHGRAGGRGARWRQHLPRRGTRRARAWTASPPTRWACSRP